MPDQGKLDLYESLVRTWAPKLDLVSPGDLDRFRVVVETLTDDSSNNTPVTFAAAFWLTKLILPGFSFIHATSSASVSRSGAVV